MAQLLTGSTNTAWMEMKSAEGELHVTLPSCCIAACVQVP